MKNLKVLKTLLFVLLIFVVFGAVYTFYNGEIDKYSHRIDELTEYQVKLVDKVNALKKNCDELTESYAVLQQTYEDYKVSATLKIEELNNEINQIKATLAELEASSDADTVQIENLKKQILNLEYSINEKNVKISDLETTISQQQSTINSLNDKVDSLVAELNSDILPYFISGEATVITKEQLKGVIKIRDYAFYKFTQLKSIEFPETVVEVGTCAFSDCSNLETVKLNDGLTTIKASAFSDCSKLKNVRFSETITSVGNRAFHNIANPSNSANNVYYLGNENNPYLFAYSISSSLVSEITIEDGCKFLNTYFCSNKSNLTTLILPTSCNVLLSQSVDSATKLSSVTINSTTVATIETPQYNFRNCSADLKIFVPSNIVEDYKTTYPTYSELFVAISSETGDLTEIVGG